MKELGIRLRDTEPQSVDTERDRAPATLASLLAALRRQIAPIVVCTLIGLGIGIVHYATTPPEYHASARVLVDDRLSEMAEEITANIPMVRNDTALLNEIQVLQSLGLAKEVTRLTDLHKNPNYSNPPTSLAHRITSTLKRVVKAVMPSPTRPVEGEPLSAQDQEAAEVETTALSLMRDVKIERVGESFSISISFASHDPNLVALVVNTYAEAYLADHLNANLDATNRTADWMQTRLEELQSSAAEAVRELEAFKAEFGVSDIQGLREREQRAETLNALHKTLSERYEQIAIQGTFPVTNGRILTSAVVPKDPAAPKAWQVLSIPAILGLMIGYLIAMWREYRERAFRTGDDVRDVLEKPFLGYLPTFKPSNLRRMKLPQGDGADKTLMLTNRLPGMIAAEAGRLIGVGKGSKQPALPAPQFFLPVIDPYSLYCETLRNIHATLDLTLPDMECRVIAMSSVLPNEGKTTLSANFANMVANLGGRTLLIDADLRRPTLSRALQNTGGPGLAEVLQRKVGLSDAVQTLPYTGLEFCPCASDPAQIYPSRIFYQQDIAALIQELRQHYDYVILDLPAAGPTVDTKVLLSQLDRLIFTCEWGATPRNLVQEFMIREPDIARKVLGVVLNNVDLKALAKYGQQDGTESYLRQYAQAYN